MPEAPINRQPAWEDITIDSINHQVEAGNIPEALALAKLRLELIKKVSAEVERNNDEGEIPLENRRAIVRDFSVEKFELQALIDYHQENPKYRQ